MTHFEATPCKPNIFKPSSSFSSFCEYEICYFSITHGFLARGFFSVSCGLEEHISPATVTFFITRPSVTLQRNQNSGSSSFKSKSEAKVLFLQVEQAIGNPGGRRKGGGHAKVPARVKKNAVFLKPLDVLLSYTKTSTLRLECRWSRWSFLFTPSMFRLWSPMSEASSPNSCALSHLGRWLSSAGRQKKYPETEVESRRVIVVEQIGNWANKCGYQLSTPISNPS